MGAEIDCTARYKGKTTKGRACIENDALEFRGADRRLRIPLSEIKKVSARAGSLAVASSYGALSLALGAVAEKWAFKIQHPSSRFDKLGVKPEWRVSAFGVEDEGFLEELNERAVMAAGKSAGLVDVKVVSFSATHTAEKFVIPVKNR